jgi:soluble lytic murein transglycosylase-like protein
MSGVQIPIQAQFDAAQLDKALADLTDRMNKVGTTVADVNNLKFNPIDKATFKDIDRVKQQMDSLKKISGDLRKRIRDTGQNDSDFFDLDWSKMYVDPNSRARQMRKAYEYVTTGTGVSFSEKPTPTPVPTPAPTPAPATPGGGGGGGPKPGAANDDDGGGKSPPSWRRKMLSSGLRAAGPVGGVADEAVGAGLSGGAMAGLAGLAGGLAALGIGKLISGIKEKIGAAEQDDVGYDTLKRQLGDVGVGFEVLKQSLHTAANEMGMTFDEARKLGTQFARVSNMSKESYATLADEVKNAAGFGRSFGVDTNQATTFFAQMRQFQVTSSTADSTKLALVIGEAIAKSGAFAKSDEVLSAIASYTSQQTRMGLTTANYGAYTDLLTGLVASKTPGLDPAGASNMLSRVNSSIQQGGNAGEAGKNFMFMTVGKELGLDPIMTSALLEQGAFGTGRSTFGRDANGRETLASQWARHNGVEIPESTRYDDRTTFSRLLSALQERFSRNPEMKELGLDAGANLFGINKSAMMAFEEIGPQRTDDIVKRMQKNGIDFSKVDATNISKLAQIENRKDLTDDQKDAMVRDAAPKSQMETIGSDIRKDTALMSNKLQTLADLGVPLLNDMRAGILYLAGNKGETGPMAIAKAVADGQHKENQAAIDDDWLAKMRPNRAPTVEFKNQEADLRRIINDPRSSTKQSRDAKERLDKLQADVDAAKAKIAELDKEHNEATEKEKKRYEDELASLKTAALYAASPANTLGNPTQASEEGPADLPTGTYGYGKRAGPLAKDDSLRQELAETDRMLKMPEGTSYRQIMQESAFDPKAISGKGAIGLAQVTPTTLIGIEKNLHKTLNPMDPHDAVLIHREAMRENLARWKNLPDALRAYNSGWDPSKWDNKETNAYVPAILGPNAIPVPPTTAQADQPKKPDTKAADSKATPATRGKPAATAAAAPAKPTPAVNGKPAPAVASSDKKRVPEKSAAAESNKKALGKQMPADAAAAEKKAQKTAQAKAEVKGSVTVTTVHETPDGKPLPNIKTPPTTVPLALPWGSV